MGKKKRARQALAAARDPTVDGAANHFGARLPKSIYLEELDRLQFELVRLQYWVRERGERLVVLFEGRDAAPVDHGRCISIETRFTGDHPPLNPRMIIDPLWNALSTAWDRRSSTAQTGTVLSQLAEASVRLSGEKATQEMGAECPGVRLA